MYIDLIKEVIVMFLVIFGLINFARFTVDRFYNIEVINKSYGIFPLFIFIWGFALATGFISSFPTINGLIGFFGKAIFTVVFVLAGLSSVSFWLRFDKLVENKLMIERLFDDHINNETFRYYKLDDYTYKALSGNPDKKELFEKVIKKKYNMGDLEHNYLVLDTGLDTKLLGSTEEFREYIKVNSVKNKYLLKIEDGEVAHLEEDFLGKIYYPDKSYS